METDLYEWEEYDLRNKHLPERGWAYNLTDHSDKRNLVILLEKLGRVPYENSKNVSLSNTRVAWNAGRWWAVQKESYEPKVSNKLLLNLIKSLKNKQQNGNTKKTIKVHHKQEGTGSKQRGKGLRVPKRTKQITSAVRLTGHPARSIQRRKEVSEGVLERHDIIYSYHYGQTGRS